MNQPFGRRAATAAATLAVAVGALLAVGGTASAASGPAVAVAHSSSAAHFGDHRYGDRANDIRYDGRDDRRDHNRYDGREGRWDGYRSWYRTGGHWYCDDHGRWYRYDGFRFYAWDHGTWDIVTGDAHGFDYRIFF
ncbi:hypothetical protein [Streptomyces sp. NPDC046805]|uniref:hypothetical protein n=1 Tax=Streptomyces sp. NPDC046805 TaxID=3155134 RepID=UPI0033E34DCC